MYVFASPVGTSDGSIDDNSFEEQPQDDVSGLSPIDEANKSSGLLTTSQGKNYNLPNNEGTLTSNVWRDTNYSQSGNTYQWNYKVSAVYSGNCKVESIKTSWQSSASLKNSASISLGLSLAGASASASSSSSWSTVKTPTKYWENTNGAKESDYSSNIVVGPSSDYKSDSITLANTASIKVKGDNKTYSYTASI